MDIQHYLMDIRTLYTGGQTTEHSFRPALAALFGSIDPGVTVINEPRRTVDVGAPDFVFLRGDVSIGHAEAKDIGKDIRKFAANDYSKAQKDRYRKGLPNLIYTNGLDFEFIRDGEAVDFITIADLIPTLPARPQEFARLENRLRDFATATPLTVTTSSRLAALMAGKAMLIKDIMGRALVADVKAKDAGQPATDLIGQYEAFKANLLHDITVEEFADIYAETIAYGLFAARLHDDTPQSFTRAEALELLPRSNPFLRELFIYIAGPNLDDRLRRVVDDLCAVFLATDMEQVLRHFGKVTKRQDPFLHFYEDFLAEYNPAKRKARGVWYTPEPVVNFIVRAVDDVLKTEFALPDGLADTSKVQVDWDTGQLDAKGKPATIKRDVHRVQILDPATGTGTFLAEVVKLVADRVKGIAPAQWSNYVEADLIPRIHGFELLMASYAMCHMKLDMILTGLGYTPSDKPPRLGVYLTNSLEEGERVDQTLPFMGLQRAIAEESKQAANIKRQTPIMCVIGNPPYSGISQNNGEWITGLIEDYKYVDGVHFGERKHWLQDDYVKFIRFAESMIAKNGEGVLGFITNHGYLDNPTFRGMRWHLMNSFDRIYVLDLHGNAKRKEVSPDGSSDKNVFDIMQGVAIIIAVKRKAVTTGKRKPAPRHAELDSASMAPVEPSAPWTPDQLGHRRSRGDEQNDGPVAATASGTAGKPLAQVRHGELWGARDYKYAAMWDGSVEGLIVSSLSTSAPQFAFVPRNADIESEYDLGFCVTDLMPVYVAGIVTARDSLVIGFTEKELTKRIARFADPSKNDAQIRIEFFGTKKLGKYPAGDSRGWKLPVARAALGKADWRSNIMPVAYRPFDRRYILYRPDMVDWGRENLMSNYVRRSNIGIATARSNKNPNTDHFFITSTISETKFAESSTQSVNAPLYLYPDEQDLDQSIRVNFDPKLYAQIRESAGLIPPSPSGVPGRPVPRTGLDLPGAGPPDTGPGVGSVGPAHTTPQAPTPNPSPEGEGDKADFRTATGDARPDEVKVFDYIYGVLHCPAYRTTYAEFLKIDFPRVPFPPSPAVFRTISEQGEALRRLHLMEEAAIGATPYPFDGQAPEGQDSVVEKPRYEAGPETGRVYINGRGMDGQYFDNVPQLAWDHPIGGYCPAQKWLKDRKGRALSYDDIRHYQRIIKILTETARIMAGITLPGL